MCMSNFTFQFGASHPRELFERAHELGYAALAITDECSLAGIVRAHEAAEITGVPLIIGSQFRFEEGDRIVLLAPTQDAYTQLSELISKARRRSVKGAYSLARRDFDESISHTIALWLPGTQLLRPDAEWFAALPRARRYFAFAHLLAQNSASRLEGLRALGDELKVPVVAVGDVHYHIRTRREAGIHRRWPQGAPAAVHEQIEKELVLIRELRFEHYFLTVEDIVRYARMRGMAIRDVARALGLPSDLVDVLSRSIQWFDTGAEVPVQLKKIGFDPNARVTRLLLTLVAEIVGFPRHLSQHVGGFVMSHRPLSTLVPVENAAPSSNGTKTTWIPWACSKQIAWL
jgi:DNA polymerase III alpha subunit